jgi:filamentous hemagglutinin family protein
MDKGSCQVGSTFARFTCVALALTCAAYAPAMANPQGGNVTEGRATLHNQANTLTIRQQSDKAVIDWRRFDIGAQEHTHFQQPSASSVTLNRVTGGGSSRIDGRLSATGKLVLVNPNGVVFGSGAKVDVSGLLASTADIRNHDFIAGKMQFLQPGNPQARIVNHGSITVRDAGLVGLVAPQVINHGTIEARLGTVQLAAGDSFTLDLYGNGLMEVQVSSNTRKLLAQQDGTIRADAGTIAISAAEGRHLIDSLIRAEGELTAPTVAKQAGKIVISGAKNTHVSGKLSATGNTHNKGGTISLRGQEIAIRQGSRLDTSGQNGGTITIGGDLQGTGEQPTSKRLTVADDVRITSNAIGHGIGGEVILWSDEHTRFAGRIEARGGAQGGAGGFAEVSSKGLLDYRGFADMLAPAGTAGTLLLDPYNLSIRDAADDGLSGTYASNQPDSVLSVTTLQTALSGGNVTVQTGAGGAQDGNITVEDALTWASGSMLTLIAANDIILDAAITALSGGLTLNAGNAITPNAAVAVDDFVLAQGAWTQNTSTLPDFSANRFRITNSASTGFVRVSGGDGSSTPYEVEDAYGLQGLASNLSLGNTIYAYRGGDTTHNGTYFDNSGNLQSDGTGGLGFHADGDRYIVHRYTQTGGFTFTPVTGVDAVSYLLVGGGGGGGSSTSFSNGGSGGGGAGGLVTNAGGAAFAVVAGNNYTVTVGAGGAGGGAGNSSGSNGANSVFDSITALGGGGGIGGNGNGLAGGSGGGGRGGTGGTGQQPGSTSGGSGNNGGTGSSASGQGGGGGGGAGGVGGAQTGIGGTGGNALDSSVSGALLAYAAGGGGGGAQNNAGGTGGSAIGGNGGNNTTASTAGTSATGSGGGGGNNSQQGSGGGSGIVMLRYLSPVVSLGGDFTVANKTYDGTTAATLESNNLTPTGIAGLTGLSITGLTANPSFALADAGTHTVSLNPASATLSGANAGFYTLSFAGAPTTTATISNPPRPSKPTPAPTPVLPPPPSGAPITQTPSTLPETVTQVSQSPLEFVVTTEDEPLQRSWDSTKILGIELPSGMLEVQPRLRQQFLLEESVDFR